jgi:hypothetical protein
MSYLPVLKQRMAASLRSLDAEQLSDPGERGVAYFSACLSDDVTALQPAVFDELDAAAVQIERRRRANDAHMLEISEGKIDE